MSIETLNELLKELKNDPRIKIVEGKRDREALEHFGIESKELTGPLPKLVSEIESDFIILTDYDRRGKELAERLRELAFNEGLHADLEYRARLKKLAGLIELEDLVFRYNQIKERGE